MTIAQLLQSANVKERLRGKTRNTGELNKWVNKHILGPVIPENNRYAAVVEVWLDLSQLDRLLETGLASIVINGAKNGPTLDYRKPAYLFESKGYTDLVNASNGRVWDLQIADWPFITVELVRYKIWEQTEEGERHTPPIVEKFLPLFFPDVDYLQLRNLYSNDLMSLDDTDTTMPTIYDIMYQHAGSVATPVTNLPDDFGNP